MNSLNWKFMVGAVLTIASALSQAAVISNSNPAIIKFSSNLFTSAEPTDSPNGSFSITARLEGDLFDENEAVTVLFYETDLAHETLSLPLEGQWISDRTELGFGGCCFEIWNDLQGFIVFRPANDGTMNIADNFEFTLVKNSTAYSGTFSANVPLPGTLALFSSTLAGLIFRRYRGRSARNTQIF